MSGFKAKSVFAALIFSISSIITVPAAADVIITYGDDEFSHPFSFSIEPFFGLRNGFAGEYVLYKENSTYDDLLSYLDWRYENLPYGGLRLNLSLNNLFLNGSAAASIPGIYGICKDSDWYNNDPTIVTSTSGYDYKTNYSEADNYLDYDYEGDVTFGFSFNPVSTLLISPSVGFNYRYYKFTAKGGWYKYGSKTTGENGTYYKPWSSATEKTEDDDTIVLEYFREQCILWLGSGLAYQLNGFYTFNRPLDISLGLFFSPLYYSFNKDHHPFTSTYYVDKVYGHFNAWKIQGGINWFFAQNLSVNLSATFTYITKATGKNYSRPESSDEWAENTVVNGGASGQNLDISLGLRYTFF